MQIHSLLKIQPNVGSSDGGRVAHPMRVDDEYDLQDAVEGLLRSLYGDVPA
jgi:hypothetical protein